MVMYNTHTAAAKMVQEDAYEKYRQLPRTPYINSFTFSILLKIETKPRFAPRKKIHCFHFLLCSILKQFTLRNYGNPIIILRENCASLVYGVGILDDSIGMI